MNTKLLTEIGLTSGEIKTYLALLHIGKSSTGFIAKESQVSRSKLYSILDKLEKKGLVSHVEENGVMYFIASEPAKIKDFIKIKEEKIKQLKDEFNNFLPELESYNQDNQKVQKVSFYQGLKGLTTAHEHLYQKLKKGETYYYLGIPANQPETHLLYWQRDHVRRIKEGIKCQLLFNKDVSLKLVKNRDKYKDCDARYMNSKIKTPSYFLIYADTVMIAIASKNPIAIEIISEEIVNSFKEYFKEFWKLSKPLKK